ncbi:Protein CATP-1 a [Aphelenchoides avenae]|nr:Protein CATP-1 a [Aphelenchus avenae]
MTLFLLGMHTNGNEKAATSAEFSPPPGHGKRKFFQRNGKVSPSSNDGEQSSRNMSANYKEHTWDVSFLQTNFPSSNIDAYNPRDSKGLSYTEAKILLEVIVLKHSWSSMLAFQEHGPNMLPKAKEISDLRLYISQFLNPLWLLLLFADVLSFISYFTDTSDMTNLWVAIIIFVMIVCMCTISWYQERKARRVVRGFENLLPEKTAVVRDGNEEQIPAAEVVVGDIIKIKSGMKVSADARVLWCSQLKLETSSITGEAEPVEYQAEAVPESVSIFESRNVAFNGSLCVDGEGIAIVIKTGVNTVIGQIATMTTNQAEGKSRMQMQITKFVKFLLVMSAIVGLIMTLAGGAVNGWKDMVHVTCTSFLVCAISFVPAGMPATVTSIMMTVARRLAKKNVYVKRLDIVEALGSCNIIASDKTGTLTKNVMTVTDVWYLDEFIAGAPNTRARAMTTKTIRNFEGPLHDMLNVMTICNTSEFVSPARARAATTVSMMHARRATVSQPMKHLPTNRVAMGTPSEIAMLKYADELIDVGSLRDRYDIVFEIPFNSKRKWHLMIAKLNEIDDDTAEYHLFIKGASDVLIKMCSTIATDLADEDLDQENMAKFRECLPPLRLEEENFPLQDLTFLGVCAIMDPPRDETRGAIEQCKTAGIKVFMVTGDHHLTATAIGKQIGLIDETPGKEGTWEVLHGERISQLTEPEWDRLVQKESLIFARTTPEQKLLIVEQCQKRKQIIAMTGDGVNDSPALKKADIGVAMGSGSEVAKQAADVVLMDDNFASIVRGVKEGRMIFDNIKKLLAYVMLHSFPELWPIIIHYCFGMPVGMTNLQIMSIDLGTELAPGIAMAQEPGEGDLMERPPRKHTSNLVSNTLLAYAYFYAAQIEAVGCFLAYCCVYWHHGINVSDLWMSSDNHWRAESDGGKPFASNGHIFSVDDQLKIRAQACAAWQMGVVFGQFFQILCVRTRRQSIFRHGLFANRLMLPAMAIEMVLVIIMIYVPGVNGFFGGGPVPWESWVMVAGFGLLMLAFNEGRKWLIRNHETNKVVHCFKW